jgi:hypothetical protein
MNKNFPRSGEVGFQGFDVIGLQGVQSLEGVLEAVNPKAVLLQVEISGGQHPDFRGAQAVAVGEQKDGIVTFRVYGIEQAAGLVLRQKIDTGRCPRF